MTTTTTKVPVVSVIMPTFNRLEFLPAAVASVQAQTFPHWELIVADDGSDAATRAYLQALHEPPRTRVIWLPHSGKPAVVSNVALREARGEYVAFLDSDDVWLPQKLETQIASLRRHPARKWSYTRFALIDAMGAPRAPSCEAGLPVSSGWILEKMLRGQILIAQPSVVVSRMTLEQLGAFDEELVMCYDDEMWLRLAAYSEIDGVDQTLTLIRRHSQHAGNDITAWRDRRRVFEKAAHAGGDARIAALLHRLRASMSAGLARSQAVSGERAAALATLLSSARHSWRYPRWWLEALRVAARAATPAAVRNILRRYRSAHRMRAEPHA